MLTRLLLRQVLPLVLIALSASACGWATVRPLDPRTGKAIIGNESQQFNASTQAAQMWDKQLIPALHTSAVPVNTLLDALRQNTITASQTYGHRPGTEQPYSFMVTGTGKVLTVNTQSRAGLALVDLSGGGQADLTLAIGPVIRGTALRDAAPFIDFNQFTNQMEYAAVSNELNALVNTKVLTPLGDVHSLMGKSVTFFGAFTLGSTLSADTVL